LVPLLAWWGDHKRHHLGAKLFMLLLVVLFFVSLLKMMFTRPRPFIINSNIADPKGRGKYLIYYYY
jgi:hypothetical protein